jgi:hypothetical protein
VFWKGVIKGDVLGSEHIRGDVWKWAYKGDVRDGFGGGTGLGVYLNAAEDPMVSLRHIANNSRTQSK